MGGFFKTVGATMLGMFFGTIIIGVIIMACVLGCFSSKNDIKVEEGTILRIQLSGDLKERREADLMSFISGKANGLVLEEALTAIDKASRNENVVGIYLEGGALSGTPASLQELRQALLQFKEKSGKFIIAYGDNYTQGSYYIASVADQVYMNPSGMLDWHGMAAELTFYTELMEKVGMKMQVYKVGTFKSAVEPFINTEMSEANRTQVTSYLNSIWGNMTKEVSASRGISVAKLNEMADSMLAFSDPNMILKEKMVDGLRYKDEVRDILKAKSGKNETESLTFLSSNEMSRAKDDIEKHEDCIAVYYAYGDIVDDTTNGLTAGTLGSIIPDPMNKELEKLMNDNAVKAVVIRVNSGGGSAYASEQIWREVTRLKAKKPVVISMGGMAASGGYYISCNASSIVAEPTTLTGSIGIFGMIPDVSELMTEKLGLHYDIVKTNKHGDFGTMSRPQNEEEGALMQAYIERGYDLFTRRVAEGRNLPVDSVKHIAEGRVWTGEQAKKLGLVDQLGGLQTAINEAARLAKTKDYCVDHYPAPKSPFENILGGDKGKHDFMETELKDALGDYYDVFLQFKQARDMNCIQARIPYILRIRN